MSVQICSLRKENRSWDDIRSDLDIDSLIYKMVFARWTLSRIAKYFDITYQQAMGLTLKPRRLLARGG